VRELDEEEVELKDAIIDLIAAMIPYSIRKILHMDIALIADNITRMSSSFVDIRIERKQKDEQS